MEDLFEALGKSLNPNTTASNEKPKVGDKYLCSNGTIIIVDEYTTDLGLALLGAKKI